MAGRLLADQIEVAGFEEARVAAGSKIVTDQELHAVERRVGLAVGPGSLYRHFPSKEALLQAAVEHEVTRLRAAMAEARAALPRVADPAERRLAF